MKDPNCVTILHSLDVTPFSRFTLHVSGDPVASAGCQASTVTLDPRQQSFACVVGCSPYLCTCLLVAALLRRETSSSGYYFDYSEVHVQGTFMILTSSLVAYRRRPIGPTTEIVSCKFVLARLFLENAILCHIKRHPFTCNSIGSL